MQNRNYPDLELEDDMVFEKRSWRAERIGWVVLTLFVLAALIGLFGRGGVSSTKTGSAEQGMEINYERFLRFHTPDFIRVLVYNTGKSGTYSLHISKQWESRVQLQRIHPQPKSEKATKNGIEYIFNVEPGHSPLEFTFYLVPQKVGTAEGSISDSEGNSVSFSQFIYP